jgi:hypothetical protein
MAYYLLLALCDAGETPLAFDLVTCRDEHSWHAMLEAGATSAMEVWTTDLKRNVSFCHAWSSVPVPVIVEKVMGLRRGTPGRREIVFDPCPLEQLDWAKLEVPLYGGTASVALAKEQGKVRYELSLPAGVELRIREDSDLVLLERDNKARRYSFRKSGPTMRQGVGGG